MLTESWLGEKEANALVHLVELVLQRSDAFQDAGSLRQIIDRTMIGLDA